jgi:hypothetical protein
VVPLPAQDVVEGESSALRRMEELESKLKAEEEARLKAEAELEKEKERVDRFKQKYKTAKEEKEVSLLLNYGYEDRLFYMSVHLGTVQNPISFLSSVNTSLGEVESI